MTEIKMETEARKYKIAELYTKGMNQRDIAAQVGTSQQFVCREIRKILNAAKEKMFIDIDDYKRDTMQKTEHIISEALDSWRKSKEKYASKTVNYAYDNGKAVKQSKSVKKENGDPKYLDVANKAIERRCKILGLDAPQKIETDVTIVSSKPARGVDEDEL